MSRLWNTELLLKIAAIVVTLTVGIYGISNARTLWYKEQQSSEIDKMKEDISCIKATYVSREELTSYIERKSEQDYKNMQSLFDSFELRLQKNYKIYPK